MINSVDVVVHTNARVYRHRTAGPRFHTHHHPHQHRAADTDVSYGVYCVYFMSV